MRLRSGKTQTIVGRPQAEDAGILAFLDGDKPAAIDRWEARA